MIVWRGYGILVVVFAVVGILFGDYLGGTIWGAPLTQEHKAASMLIGMLVAAVLVFGTDWAIGRNTTPKTYIDKATGEEVQVRAKHDLFFIPVKYWPYLLALLGVFLFFQK